MQTDPSQESTVIDGRKLTVTPTEILLERDGNVTKFSRLASRIFFHQIPSTAKYAKARKLAPNGVMVTHDEKGNCPFAITTATVAEFLRSQLRSRLPGLYMIPEALAGSIAVSRLFEKANRTYENGGCSSYYRQKGEAEAANEAWVAQFPGSAKLRRAHSLRAKATSINDNYCDLDGSLSPEYIKSLNAERETERQALRAEAAKLEEEAADCWDVEVEL